MSAVFADTYYFLALVNRADSGHAKARAFRSKLYAKVVTTGWVLTELGDALSGTARARAAFVSIHGELQTDPDVQMFSCDDAIIDDGVLLYSQRPDKQWSLTDCISFVVMNRERITDALTADHHFEQAGFNALLK